MGLTCEIFLNNANGVYKPGDSVEGTVKYVIGEPMEFTSVTLSLKGKGLCFCLPITPETLYIETEDYVEHLMDLLQAKDNRTTTIPEGTYYQYFYFALPQEIPSSYKDFKCYISFSVQLEFVERNPMSIPKRFYKDIQVKTGVKPQLKENYNVYEIKKVFMLSKSTVTLKAGIKKPFVYAGEDIIVISEVSNNAGVPLVSTKTELIEFVSYKSNENEVKQTSKTLKGVEMIYIGMNRLETEQTQTINISTTSYKFSIDTRMLIKRYAVKVTLTFAFPHRELCLEIPVVVVEKIEEEKMDVLASPCWQAMNEKSVREEET